MSEMLTDNQIGADFSWIKSATPPKLVMYPTDKVVVNIDRNHRDEVKTYDPTYPAMKILIDSMRSDGWTLGSYVILHQNSVEMHGNLNVEVLRGHRRVTAAKHAGIPKVPGILISGLTEAQKLVLIAETPTESLKAIGEFKAVRDLIGKMGDQKIADHLKIAKNKVQEYRYINDLPTLLQDKWRNHVRGVKGAFPVGRPAIMSLHAARDRDWAGIRLDAAGMPLPANVNLINRDPNGGPEYLAVLNELETSGIPEKTTVTKKALKAMVGGIKETTIRDIILGLADEPGTDTQKALDKAVDVATRFNNLVSMKITNPVLLAFVNGFTSSDADLDRARHKQVKDVIEVAIVAYLESHPECNPFPQWEKDDAHKAVVADTYEGALPSDESALAQAETDLTAVEPEVKRKANKAVSKVKSKK